MPEQRGQPGRPRALTLACALVVVAPFGRLEAGPQAPATARPGGPPSAAVGAVPSDPAFAALLTDGSTAAGRLVAVDPTRGVILADAAGLERAVAVDRLVKLTRAGAPAPPAAVEGGIVLLPKGDRLAHANIGAAGTRRSTSSGSRWGAAWRSRSTRSPP